MSSSLLRRAFPLLCAAAVSSPLMLSTGAEAGEPQSPSSKQSAPNKGAPPGDVKKAEALFVKAIQLKKNGKQKEACALFQQSQDLDPNGATLLNLADCHDLEGKSGTAYRELTHARTLAEESQDEKFVKSIQERIDAVRPKLYQITVEIPLETKAIKGLEVELDDKRLFTDVQIHVEVVDPGRHIVRARAPGYLDLVRPVTVAGENRLKSVLVSLEKIPPPPPPDHTLDWTLIVAGSALIVTSGVMLGAGLSGGSTQHDELFIGSVILGGLGVPIVIAGLVLLVTKKDPISPKAATSTFIKAPAISIRPLFGPGSGYVGVTGSF